MSSGKQHRIQGYMWGVGLAIILAAFYFHRRHEWRGVAHILTGLIGYLMGTSFLSPDHDLWHSTAKSAWGVLAFIWAPFAWAVKHRSYKSHSLYGTLLRLAYLLNWIWMAVGAIMWLAGNHLSLLLMIYVLIAFSMLLLGLAKSDWLTIGAISLTALPTYYVLYKHPWVWTWVLAPIVGLIVADLCHFLYDKVDNLYRDRPKWDGKRRGWQ